MRHVARDHRQAHIDLAEEGLDLDHLGHLARGGENSSKARGTVLSSVKRKQTSTA